MTYSESFTAGLAQPDLIIVKYAYMPVKHSNQHTLLRQLPVALRAKMDEAGLTQMQLFKLIGVPQPQISRALAGKRKRLTEPMRKLCVYACLLKPDEAVEDRRAAINLLMRQLVGDNPAASQAVEGVLLSLAPLLDNLRRTQ